MTLIKTTVFRLSLAFAAFFVLLTIGALLYVYIVTIRGVEGQTETELFGELKDLEFHYLNDGQDPLVNLLALRDNFGHHLQHYYAFVNTDEAYVAGSQFLAGNKPKTEFERQGVTYFQIAKYITDDNKELVLRVAQLRLADGAYLVAAVAQDFLTELRRNTLNALATAVAITVLLAILTGMYMGRSVLSRIWRLDNGLAASINGDFKQGLPVPSNEDEFQALTLKLNLAIGRVADLIQGMREVTDNIAHDLRTPLTRMQSRLEVALLRDRSDDEYRQVITQTIEDCSALLNTFNALLSIAQAESGASRENLETIDITQVADELVEFYFIVAEEKNLRLNWKKPASVYVKCRRQALAQAISNLLENAIKYTPAGGAVTLNVEQHHGSTTIKVCDTGPGIPEKERKRVLERFQRLDNARSQPGSGLGLSMVNAVAKLCRAELVMGDNNPGLAVELRFPATVASEKTG